MKVVWRQDMLEKIGWRRFEPLTFGSEGTVDGLDITDTCPSLDSMGEWVSD